MFLHQNAGGQALCRVARQDGHLRLTKDLEHQMKTAAKNLEFEKAALLRDQVVELRKAMLDGESALHEFAQSSYGSLGDRPRAKPGRYQRRAPVRGRR